MSIDKAKALSILGGLDAESLIRALAANGINLGRGKNDDGSDGDVLGALSPSQDDNKITGWNERKIKVSGKDDRPSLVDKDFLQTHQDEMRLKALEKQKMGTPYMEEGYDASLDPYNRPEG